MIPHLLHRISFSQKTIPHANKLWLIFQVCQKQAVDEYYANSVKRRQTKRPPVYVIRVVSVLVVKVQQVFKDWIMEYNRIDSQDHQLACASKVTIGTRTVTKS